MLSRLSPYWLWVVLALPALPMIPQIISDPAAAKQLVHPTGEFAARFMIIAMLATPLMMLFRTRRWPRWLMHHRRHFGVAAFVYAALHLCFYLIKIGSLPAMLAEFGQFRIWTGWAAFAIFVPLAVTSNNLAQRLMRQKWKSLQRLTYGAAVLTFLHWAALKDWGGLAPALVHFTPVILLSAWRIWYWYLRPRPVRATA